jgi:hypothetical protein
VLVLGQTSAEAVGPRWLIGGRATEGRVEFNFEIVWFRFNVYNTVAMSV